MNAALEPDRLTQEEARARGSSISDVHYRMELELRPGAATYAGECAIRFGFSGEADTFLDFVGTTIEWMDINGLVVEPQWLNNRIVLPAAHLRGRNEVRVRYVNTYDHSGEGFHQFIDPIDGGEYLYTQFEPFAAHRLFPCFDQPDLKATYEVAVTAPAEWEVLSASRVESVEEAGNGSTRRLYETTVPFSTYLLSIVAGPYARAESEHNGIPLGLYCQASLAEHLDAEVIFQITADGLDFFTDFFGTPYPFTKYDQIFVPEFNWGGMENVANVTYVDHLIFRDPPTENQRLGRAEVLLHELAHQWFGDLVTMEWWNDVWLNESFASYMAYLALERVTSFPDPWQNFLTRMKLWAYAEDQLPTTHQIADHIPSTDETFLNFDGITYGKGASALKQLVASLGEQAFRRGMQTYFQRHAYGNATLADFLGAIETGSGVHLEPWSRAWLEAPSLNTLSVQWQASNDSLQAMTLHQTAPAEYATHRPHYVEIAVVTESEQGLKVSSFPARVKEATVELPGSVGQPPPVLVYPNYRDHTFAKVMLDPVSLEFAMSRLGEISDALFRQLLWAALWDMVRDQHLSSLDYLRMVQSKMAVETDQQILKMVTDTATAAIARYVPDVDRIEQTSQFVAAARGAIDVAEPGDARVIWLRALLRVAETPDDLVTAADLVDGRSGVDGLPIDQEMRWEIALRWSAAGLDGSHERAARELERDPSHRGRRAMIAIETSRPEQAVKEEGWMRLHADGYGSLDLDRAAMRGFNWPHQRELLDPYVELFFATLPDIFASREHEAAASYFSSLYPTFRVDEEALALAHATLERSSASSQLTRMLVEAIDHLQRAIACRRFAEGT